MLVFKRAYFLFLKHDKTRIFTKALTSISLFLLQVAKYYSLKNIELTNVSERAFLVNFLTPNYRISNINTIEKENSSTIYVGKSGSSEYKIFSPEASNLYENILLFDINPFNNSLFFIINRTISSAILEGGICKEIILLKSPSYDDAIKDWYSTFYKPNFHNFKKSFLNNLLNSKTRVLIIFDINFSDKTNLYLSLAEDPLFTPDLDLINVIFLLAKKNSLKIKLKNYQKFKLSSKILKLINNPASSLAEEVQGNIILLHGTILKAHENKFSSMVFNIIQSINTIDQELIHGNRLYYLSSDGALKYLSNFFIDSICLILFALFLILWILYILTKLINLNFNVHIE